MFRAHATPPARSRRRAILWRAVAASMATLALVAGTALSGELPAANAASGQIRGHVFLDFDGDGVFDSGNSATSGIANDTPSAGITVEAYNAANALVGTATTAGTGNPNYTIALTGVADGAPLRIEFTLPAGTYNSFQGTNSNTSVRFVAAGAENVDLGIVRPADYNSNDPYVGTVIQRAGIPTAAGNTSAPAVVLNRWSVANNVTGSTADYSARKAVATIGQVGSVYSIAYDTTGRDLYVAATYKRGAGLGTNGLGGIYRINDPLDAAGNLTAGIPTVTNWVDVAATAGLNINVGTALSNTARSLNASNGVFADPDGFAKATKIGIGGMVIDSDRGVLYFVNLNDKKIYGITLSATPTLVGSWATPATSTQRPFALSLRNGALYVGYNDSGEAYPFCPASSPGILYLPGSAGTCTGNTGNPLRAYVARATLNTSGAPGAWTTVLTAPLNYAKGNEIYGWQQGGATVANANPQVLRWNTWTDQWTGAGYALPVPAARDVSFKTDGNWGNNYYLQVYPQPFVASISFDSAGFLTLGLGDRTATQSGNRQVAADQSNPGTNTTTYETLASGDTLLAALNSDGTYTLESNGTATGTSGVSRSATTGRDSQPTNAEGPGGNEFYYDRQNLGNGALHREATLGATLIAQGVTQVASTMIDPLNPIRVAGLAWFDSTNGDIVRGYQQEDDTGGGPRTVSFQKGGGLGGLTLLLRDAPIELGNRVWYDADLDGLQDADEPAINGAPVQLWTADASGNPVTQIGSTTTATVGGQAGTWYFRTEGATGGTTGFTKNAKYVVIFPSGTGAATLVWPTGMAVPPGFAGLTWAQLQRTTASAGGTTTRNDSNPNISTGRAPVTVGGGSANDHTIDAGWYGMSTYRVEKAIAGTAPAGATYTFNITVATNFRGDDRRWTSGAASDPIVDTLSYTLTAGQILTTTERVPYGYTLTFAEANIPDAAVVFSPQVVGNDNLGLLTIAPTALVGGVKVTATNSYGALTVTKLLATPASLPPGTTFPIEYTINAGSVVTAEVAVGAANKISIPSIPWGSTVKIREPLTAPFSWGGYVWVSPSWTNGATTLVQDVDGWVTVTGFTSTTPIALTLTNRPLEVPSLPFAGGIGEDLFTIAGGMFLLVGVAFVVWQLLPFRRRRVAVNRA